jgi:hypothetical protein
MTCPDTCSCCGATADGIDAFAAAYRAKELQAGRGDPGHLCGECAGWRDAGRLGSEISAACNRSASVH